MTDLTPAAQAHLDHLARWLGNEWSRDALDDMFGDDLAAIEADARANAEAERLTVERLDAALGKAWGHILRMTDYNESRAEVAAAIIAALAAPPAEPRE